MPTHVGMIAPKDIEPTWVTVSAWRVKARSSPANDCSLYNVCSSEFHSSRVWLYSRGPCFFAGLEKVSHLLSRSNETFAYWYLPIRHEAAHEGTCESLVEVPSRCCTASSLISTGSTLRSSMSIAARISLACSDH